jgi:RNA polymerase sigma-70 factor (ECF subfamily)
MCRSWDEAHPGEWVEAVDLVGENEKIGPRGGSVGIAFRSKMRALSTKAGEDWLAIADGIVAGDRIAFAKFARLITSFLRRWRAFDFRDDWEDLIQEVVLATIEASARGQIEHAGALVAFARSVTRNKFVDRLRRYERRDVRETSQEEDLALPPESSGVEASREEILDLRRAVEALPENQRRAVLGVYAEGKTYEEASEDAGIPLGSLKRYLRQALEQLGERMAPSM